MAAKVGKLNVQLTAGTRGLSRGLKRGQSLISGFAGSGTRMLGGLTGAFGKLSGLAGIAGVTLSIGGAVVAIKKGADAVDDLAKKSKRLFGKGDTGALAGIRLAAEENGASAETADKAMGKLLDTISAAGNKEPGAVKALKAIGLSAKELLALRPEERFGVVADKIRQLSDSGDQIRVARDIFGKAGEELIPMLQQGSKAIRQATQEMREYGHAVSALDASKVESVNDNIGKLKKIGQGITMQLAVQLAPLVEDVTIRLLDMIHASGGVGKAVENAFNQGVDFAANFLTAVEDLQIGWLNLKKTVYEVARDLANGIFNLGREGGGTADSMEKELERRAQMMAPDKREEFKRRAREAGGFGDERVHFGRVGEAFGEQAAGVDQEIKDIERRRKEKGTLGARFKEYVYEAQTSAVERAQNRLLENEEAITGELKAQKDLREQQAGQGRAALTAFNGPVAEWAAMEQASAHISRRDSGGKESGETNRILTNIHNTLRGGVVASMG